MVTLKRHNVKVYVNCLSYFIFVLQNGVLKGVIWYWVPYFTHEFIYFSSLRNNIFSFFCAPVGILKTIPSVHTTVSVCEEIPSSSFMYRPQWPPHLQRETYISWDIIMTSASFFFRSKYFISGELAVIVIKMAGFTPYWLKGKNVNPIVIL